MNTTFPVNTRVAIKFLLPNALAGSLIGAGGKSIKELMALTDTKVYVSSQEEPFPGSLDRVVLISGTQAGVSLAQALIWEMVGAMAKAGGDVRSVEWSPQTALENRGQTDTDVTARFTIPASAGGAVLGRGGTVIQHIATESGARVSMTSKEEALLTQERVLTVSGRVSQCAAATDKVIERLCAQDEIPVFVNRGTKYSAPLPSALGMGMGMGMGFETNNYKRQKSTHEVALVGAPSVADTTITLQIPEEHVGNIFGRAGATLREISALSGAKVHVSGRGDFAEGTTNRIVTITGPPASTQAAHIFLTQRLQMPSNPPPRRASNL